jgi:HEAT repeat protein
MFYRISVRHEQQTLKKHVDALENGPVGTVNLGVAQAAPTEDTEYLISQGEAAVPLLIEALKRDDNPNTIRYAAYCLRRMRSDRGREVAANIYAKLAAKEVNNMEEVDALRELSIYLKDLDHELEH